MEQYTLQKGFYVETDSKPGITSQLTSLMSENGQNIKSFWESSYSGKGHFAFIAENWSQVKDVLKSSPFSNFREEDYVVAYVSDKAGVAAELINKLARANINITWMYSTYYNGKPALVFNCDNNNKALETFKH